MNHRVSRRNLIRGALAGVATTTAIWADRSAASEAGGFAPAHGGVNGCHLMPGAEFYVAVDNKGLWPNLTRLPNGELAAAVYNHPSHGLGSNSDVELWVSPDEGRSWAFRSRVSDHADNPNAIRMNHAVGLNADGQLVALVSGYQEGQRLPLLPLQRCISADHGVTWDRDVVPLDRVPFGDVFPLPDGTLVCPAYRRISRDPKRSASSVLFSDDGGRTWGDERAVADTNETHVVRLSSGVWLAAGRTSCLDRMDGSSPTAAVSCCSSRRMKGRPGRRANRFRRRARRTPTCWN